eukprot:SAG22_NODE_154_length_17189_cov_38.210064_8_plen_428_part_00
MVVKKSISAIARQIAAAAAPALRPAPCVAMDWCIGASDGSVLASIGSPIPPPTIESSGSSGAGATEPQRIAITCTSLAGAAHSWLRVFKLEREYQEASVDAEISGPAAETITVHTATNIRLFEILRPPGQPITPACSLTVEGQVVDVSPVFEPTATLSSPSRLVLFNVAYKAEPPGVEWIILASGGHGKSSVLKGPIDDAFGGLGRGQQLQQPNPAGTGIGVLCVTGSGQAWDPAAERWSRTQLADLRTTCSDAGAEVRVLTDTKVTAADATHNNLVLFGDPGSNSWIARALPWLPIADWTREHGLQFGRDEPPMPELLELRQQQQQLGQSSLCLQMISPSPFHHERYIVLNAGGRPNRLLPQRSDYAVVALPPDWHPRTTDSSVMLVRAGFCTNEWCLVGEERRVSYKFAEANEPLPVAGARAAKL